MHTLYYKSIAVGGANKPARPTTSPIRSKLPCQQWQRTSFLSQAILLPISKHGKRCRTEFISSETLMSGTDTWRSIARIFSVKHGMSASWLIMSSLRSIIIAAPFLIGSQEQLDQSTRGHKMLPLCFEQRSLPNTCLWPIPWGEIRVKISRCDQPD